MRQSRRPEITARATAGDSPLHFCLPLRRRWRNTRPYPDRQAADDELRRGELARTDCDRPTKEGGSRRCRTHTGLLGRGGSYRRSYKRRLDQSSARVGKAAVTGRIPSVLPFSRISRVTRVSRQGRHYFAGDGCPVRGGPVRVLGGKRNLPTPLPKSYGLAFVKAQNPGAAGERRPNGNCRIRGGVQCE